MPQAISESATATTQYTLQGAPVISSTGWIIFAIIVVVLLVVDHVAHQGERGRTRRAAMIWSIVWVGAGLLFNVYVWINFGNHLALEYLAAYAIEKSLSLDNLFVFLIIFSSLNIPKKYQHEVLFWGILGAVVFRGIFIFAGAAAIEHYHWVSYVFGGILLLAAWRTYREDPTEETDNASVKWLSRHLPISQRPHGGKFIARENGRLVATSLFIALCAIELTDILFAIDSVAAALAMTDNLFVLYSSNIFAILGLRALYLLLSHLIEDLRYLHYGLAVVLAFAGIKIMIPGEIPPPAISVAIIIFVIGASVWASLRAEKADVAAAKFEADGTMQEALERQARDEDEEERDNKAHHAHK